MDSLSSRYLHRKLSTGSNGFSAKNTYDDVFAGHPPKFGAQKISPARLEEDYKEIFGSSRASSIPILDLPADNDTNGTADFRSSKLDYSNIFGGFRDEDGSVSYEELVANDRKIREKSSSGKFRYPSATGSPLQNSDRLSKDNKVFSSEASYQSFDDKKQFNMPYHKASLGSKDGTTHVAQFHPVPGFTCFVDETTPQKTEADKPNPLLKNDIRREVDFCEGILEGRNAKKATSNLANKQAFGREVKSRSGFSWDGSYSNGKLFNAHDIDLKSHPSKVRPASSMASKVKNSNDHSKRSTVSNTEAPKNDVSEHAAGDCSPSFCGEELDVNSAAAASAAVLKNAIQKAQESIRIAKELMERKKEGLRSSNRSFKDRLKVADRRENIIAHEGSRTEDKNAQDTCGSVDSFSQVFSGMGRKSALRSGEVVPDFKDPERTFVAGKVIGDAYAKNLGAAEKYEPATWFSTLMNIGKNRTAISSIEQAVGKYKNAQSMEKDERNVKEMNIISETLKQQEVVVHKEKADEKAHELAYMERKSITVITEQESEDNLDKLESDCVVHEHEKSRISQDDEENEEKQTGFYRNENCEKKLESQQKIEDEMKFEAHKLMENDFEKRLDKAQELEENENEQQEVSRQEHIEKTTKDVEKEEHELKLKRICDEEVDEERFEDAFQWVENENELKEARGSESNERKEKDIHMGEDTECRSEEIHELKIDEKTAKDVLDGKESEELFEEFELEENEKGVTECYRYEEEYIHIEAEKDIHMGEDTECRPEEVHELKIDEKTAKDVLDGKESEELFEEFELEENERGVTECYRYEKEYIHIEAEKIEVLQEAQYEDNYNKASNAWSHNVSDNISETRENCQREINDNSTEPSQDVDDNNRSMGATKDFYDFEVGEAEAVKIGYKLKEKETSRTASFVQGVAEDGEAGNSMTIVFDVLPSEDSAPRCGSIDMYFGRTEFAHRDKDNELDPNLGNGIEILPNGSTENEDIFEENETTYDEEAGKSSLETSNGEQQYIEVMEDLETSHRPNVSREEEKTIQIDEEIRTRENTEKNEENFRKTITMEEKKTKIGEEIKTSQGKEVNEENPNEVFAMGEKETRKAVRKGVEENEYLRKIEEANTKEREREKDRIAVERAIREARERAFAGARERAERAAVERATAEVRHRVMAEARGKLEKATAATKSIAEKASIEAKLRSERAAVERATEEARERALEKALSQNATSRAQVERFVAEKFSVPSRDNAMKKSLSSSDLQRSDETNTDSAQRSKARLERHERIMERAAKALAEKNMRDLLAQKEQAEKNRLSEALDVDVKRWSSGKEGNLRALLSTLQYILGPGSGWQPISLTDIVTTSAVKKAYRKATLYVHPDKLQQRGASIQQKYVCEKVFDLLKAAWNRFNSEER